MNKKPVTSPFKKIIFLPSPWIFVSRASSCVYILNTHTHTHLLLAYPFTTKLCASVESVMRERVLFRVGLASRRRTTVDAHPLSAPPLNKWRMLSKDEGKMCVSRWNRRWFGLVGEREKLNKRGKLGKNSVSKYFFLLNFNNVMWKLRQIFSTYLSNWNSIEAITFNSPNIVE